MTNPVILYLHGFASGPGSTKGRALEARFAARGVAFHRADLTPGEMGFERSTPSTMLAEAERLVAALRPRVVMGSSLGGYLAALVAARAPGAEMGAGHVPEASAGTVMGGPEAPLSSGVAAERELRGGSSDPAVERVVLLAPAFRLFERWRARLTPTDAARWREEGLEVWHYASARRRRLGWQFMKDAAALPPYPEVRVPALCLAGRRDEVVPLEDVERFVALSRTARLVVLEDGHELIASIDRIFDEAWAFLEPVLT